MKKSDQQYDVVFSTELATIGLRFAGSKLIKVKYLDKQSAERALKTSQKAPGKIAEAVKTKIEKYLEPGSKSKSIKVDVLLNVTAFQGEVLKQLQKIPYGETQTYGEIAKILKTSARAVGNACRNNPVPIIIPCHRVVAASGIGGYDGARSGELLTIKRKLLAREGVFL